MKYIMVDSFTFEVARAVDRDLSERIGCDFSLNTDRQRLVAVLLALKDSGLLSYYEYGRKTWFCFGPPHVRAVQLNEIKDLTEGSVQDASKYFISFAMRKTEMLRSIKLAERYRADLDEGVVESSWTKLGEIVRLIVENRLCLMGTELENGLIIEDLTRFTANEICLVWFSLSDRTIERPSMEDLEELSVIDGGRSIRWPIKATVAVSPTRPAFVSLMATRETSARQSMIAVILDRIAEEGP